MLETSLFFQYGNKHFNLTTIKFIESATDCSHVNLFFVDGTTYKIQFDNEDEYSEFIRLIRNLKA
jgi:hypothetical protein